MPNVKTLRIIKPKDMKKYSAKCPVKTILPFVIAYPHRMYCRQKGAGPCDHHTEKR